MESAKTRKKREMLARKVAIMLTFLKPISLVRGPVNTPTAFHKKA